jgi:hypothetical protein
LYEILELIRLVVTEEYAPNVFAAAKAGSARIIPFQFGKRIEDNSLARDFRIARAFHHGS